MALQAAVELAKGGQLFYRKKAPMGEHRVEHAGSAALAGYEPVTLPPSKLVRATPVPGPSLMQDIQYGDTELLRQVLQCRSFPAPIRFPRDRCWIDGHGGCSHGHEFKRNGGSG
jgi:hypothetical protein